MFTRRVIGVVLVGVVLLGALGLYLYPIRPGSDTATYDNRVHRQIQNERRIQWILLHRKDRTLQLIYLLSYEPISKRLSAVYIPPDARIMVPSLGELRSLRELHKSRSPDGVRSELSAALKLDIPYWVETGEGDLKKLINLLGGTWLPDPNTADPNLLTLDSENLRWIDGDMARVYVSRSYRERGIRGLRFRHKTFFLGTTAWLQQNQHLLTNQDFVNRVVRSLNTNMNQSELTQSMKLMLTLEQGNVKFPAAFRQQPDPENARLRGHRIKNMLPKPLKKIIESSKPQKIIRVQILNGAGVPGLAGALRDFLQPYKDVDVVEVGNADEYNYSTTHIIDRSNNPQSAYRIQKLLKTGEIESDPTKELLLDVTLIAGKDLKRILYKEKGS